MGKFTLINPAIIGNINTTSDAATDVKAAKEIWDNISKHINNNVPLFLFTLRGGDSLSHFSVKESAKGGGNEIDFLIEKIYPNLDDQKEIKYANKASRVLKKLKNYQTGGKRKKNNKKRRDSDDDDEDDDDDDDLENYYSYIKIKKRPEPISYWWYTPSFYQQDYNVIFTPTFKTLVPYVQWQYL
jgi:hypothetical protein